nr:reverse transcriptase domain-containing protein [Tanacetum cinerariifolium]
MQIRSSSRLVSDQSSNPTSSTNSNPKGCNRRRSKQRIAPIEGYEDEIVVPAITADNFELKHGLLTLVQNKQFCGHDKEDPHAHIRYFNKITSTLKFPNFFLPSKTTSLHNEITNFQQWFDESFSETWDRFKDLLRACPHHGFSELHQLYAFYNALNSKDQDSLNSAAGGNFLDKMPRDYLSIIESKSKVCYSHDKPVVSKVSTNASTSGVSPDAAELKDMVKVLLLDKKGQNQSPTPVKAVEESCVTCGGAHSYCNYPATDGNVYRDNIQEFVSQAPAVNYNQGNTSYPTRFANPKSDLKAITTRSGVSYDGPQIPPPVEENEHEATKDTVNPTNNENTEDVQPQTVQSKSPVSTEPAIALVSASKPNPKASIPYPSRRNDERNREKVNNQIEKFYQIFKDMSFEISFADALILFPKFASTLKALIRNKEELSEMARTLLNEHCSMVLFKKLPEKLGDPGKFLIPCNFPGMVECLALADLGASINLMPFSVWKRLSLPDLTPTCMTLELADRSISRPVGVVEDVYVKVGSFHFLADFVVVDFDADPRVPLILRRSFLKTERALIEKEFLGFSDTILSGSPTPYHDPIVSATSPTLTPFENSDFLFEEVDAFLVVEDESTSSNFQQPYLCPEGDILLLEAFLNDDPSSPPPNQRNYLPEVRKELKICEAKTDKSSVDEPLVVELKALPPHLEYALTIQHQRRVYPKIHDIIKQEVIKLLDAGLIYLISDSPWVSPVHCIPKKGGFTVVENEDNELIPTCLMLERLAGNQYYCFLDGFFGYFQIPINPKDQEKTIFTCPYGTFGYRRMPFGLCNAPGTFQRCMMAIFHDMIEKTIEVFMDDFSVFGNSFQSCLSHLEKMLKRCEDTNLCLNWEKSHFMVKEGIVIGHKISKQGIEVDKAKVDVISKLPHPTTIKGIRSFLGHAGFYRRFIKDFSKIARPMTRLLEKDTQFIFSQECVDAFQTLKRKLTEAPILIAPDWDMPFELMCDASDFAWGCPRETPR